VTQTTRDKEVRHVKLRRSDVRRQAHAIPALKFESQSLTSFSGLVLFQQLFAALNLSARLRIGFRHLTAGKVFGPATIFLQLVVHLLLGFRELRDSRAYRDDPLVKRILGLGRLPDVSTVSRMLQKADAKSVENLRRLLREMLFERLAALKLTRITLDFDGSVQSTRRHAEGTAVGYNKKRKGARSYYPLFCTIAQTAQVLDLLHRSGNVHDSNGAQAFILACVAAVRKALPDTVIEVRMDSAFFSDAIVTALEAAGIEFTLSVPFERFVQLKRMIEHRRRWRWVNADVSYFEDNWKPKAWNRPFRFLFVRTRALRQHKEPVQFDLFIPHETGYDFKVIVTNKALGAKHTVAFHEGRGSQEGIFGELKTHCQMGYVPVRRRLGNQLYLLAGLFAHNLTRELQMRTTPPKRQTTPGRAALWAFEKLDTLRNTMLHRAGRLTRPQGILTLTLNANGWLQHQFLGFLHALRTLRPAA
jgi:Transposase DDE domain group 1